MIRPPLESRSANAATLAELAQEVGAEVTGDGSVMITDAGPLGDATTGMIVLADHEDRLTKAIDSSAAAVVAPRRVDVGAKPAILVDDVHAVFSKIVTHFHPEYVTPVVGISPAAIIDPSATLSPKANIHPGAVIGPGATIGDGATIHSGAIVSANCTVADDAILFANATLYPGVSIGERTLIHAGAVIGAYGFGYSQSAGRHVLTAQLGAVQVGADVEIGAGACIDRGVYGPTRIGEGTKIDNLVQIGHNCQIGRHNLICSQVGIAGSTQTGDYVVMAGQTGVRDHVTIGHGAQLGAKCGVSNDVPAGTSMLGIPAVPERMQKLRFAAIAKLPEMRKAFKTMRKQIAELEARIAEAEPTPTDAAATGSADRAA